MSSTLRDFSVLDRFHLERKPVGIKYLPTRPENIPHLEKALNFCEMLKEAQTSAPFYVTKGDFHCVEPMLLGMEDPEPALVSGLFGAKDNLFKEARACRQMYNFLPKMLKGSVHSVAFSSVDRLTFEPDVLVMVATVSQAQTLLRSVNYSTGEMISSKLTPVVACSWLFIHPVISGEINYAITGISLGMSALRVFPEGLIIISVPWTKFSTMLENLQEIKPLRSSTTSYSGDEHRDRVKNMMENLRKEIAR
jgi:uncharacterized protein (DUF169 family)